MNHNKIKNQLISDMTSLVKSATNIPDNWGDSLDVKNYTTAAQIKNATFKHLYDTDLPEHISSPKKLVGDSFEYHYDVHAAVFLKNSIKNKFGNGKDQPNKISPPRRMDRNGLSMQYTINALRSYYQSKIPNMTNSYKKQKILKDTRIPKDIILLCWSYITNPKNTEGVHLPYTVEPKLIRHGKI